MRLFAVTGSFPTVFVSAKISQLMQRLQRRIKPVLMNHATTSQPQLFPGSRRRAGMLSPNS
jgi:hypothetical protein